MMWFFRHFWIFISYHIFLLNQVEGAIAIPPSNSAPLPLFCPSVRLSVNRSVNHIFRFLHICWQVTGKEWHRVRNADVSRWLTLGQHWCRWVLLSFHAFVRPSNHPWAWVCVLHTKRLEEMAYNLACWCIQMAYTQHSWMLMDIVVGLSVRPSVRLFVDGIFRWLCICWQITWNKWHKIWHDDVVIIGRWLLPSVVDTGDICCHYWQLILVLEVWQYLWNSYTVMFVFIILSIDSIYQWIKHKGKSILLHYDNHHFSHGCHRYSVLCIFSNQLYHLYIPSYFLRRKIKIFVLCWLDI